MNISEQIEDARSGKVAAQRCLFDHLADSMMALCCRYVKSREDAEEILLDRFYKFFRHLGDFRPSSPTAGSSRPLTPPPSEIAPPSIRPHPKRAGQTAAYK